MCIRDSLHAGDRPAIEHFFLVEMDDVSLYWRFFRTMTPMTVNVYVTQMRFDNGCVAYGAFFDERLVGVAELSAIPGSETCAENRPGSLSCGELGIAVSNHLHHKGCLLYTSDAADERSSVDPGGRRTIKKKKKDKSKRR